MFLVINFGGQYCHLIARRIRELNNFAEVVPHDISVDKVLSYNPDGIFLSGGPHSVYAEAAPHCDKEIFQIGIPVLGICYGQQLINLLLGGSVKSCEKKEYGRVKIEIKRDDPLFAGVDKHLTVWMSHGDQIDTPPTNFVPLVKSDTCPIAGFVEPDKKLYGIQFHPEVVHTECGHQILKNFLKICNAKDDWHLADVVTPLVREIKDKVKDDGIIIGVSGGVDSLVASFLIKQATDNIFPVFIDNGLMRLNEEHYICELYKANGFDNFEKIDAKDIFLNKLKGITDPEEKRKIIGHTFIEVFQNKVLELKNEHPDIKYLGQGTIYPDRIESAEPSKTTEKIKSHHNLSLPDDIWLQIVEPLKDFYKDEVRKLGKILEIEDKALRRHPFPGPGLAIRIIGDVTEEKLEIVRNADAIFIEELHKHNCYNDVWQGFVALLPVRSVGVMGDTRTYDNMISVRAVASIDGMTADWVKLPYELLEVVSNRIINEVKGVNRVVYDISQKPPSTIEYE